MNRSIRFGFARLSGVISAGMLALAVSCGYFDPLDPLAREPAAADDSVSWERVIRPTTIPGAGTGDDRGSCVQQTADGGFIIAGYLENMPLDNYNYGAWLVKTDAAGNVEWEESYGGDAEAKAFFVQQAPDEGYIVTGYKETSPSEYDLWLFKVKPDTLALKPGELEWERTYGEADKWECGYCVLAELDGSEIRYIVAGDRDEALSQYSDAWLFKTDAAGTTLWSNTYGNALKQDYARSVVRTLDGGYLIAGEIQISDTDVNAWMIKTDASGNYSWEADFGKTTGETADNTDRFSCVIQSSDGGYVLAGETNSYSVLDYDAWMIKTDDSGQVTPPPGWSRTYGVDGYFDWGACVRQTLDGGYILAGMTRSGPLGAQNEDFYLVKTDSGGEQQWYRNFGRDSNEAARSVCETTDGGYVAVGYTNSFSGGYNMYLVYYNPDTSP